jgi:hypothetical protein
MLMAGLLCLGGSVLSEPMADRDEPAGGRGSDQVWGDPEDREQANRGWTWFGMGYERRTRTSAGPVVDHQPARTKAGGGNRGGPRR